MTLSQRLLAFIQENLIGEADGPALTETDSLLNRGVIDSIGLFQLMTFLEQETGIRVPDDEVMPENFETVANMQAMVHRLQARS